MTGPGLPHAVTLTDDVPFVFFMGRPGGHALLPHRPDGPLGPRFVVTYPAVWGPDSGKVTQYVYPYARPRPVTYTPPHQRAMPLLPGYTWEAAHRSFTPTFLQAVGLPASVGQVGSEATPKAPTGSGSPWRPVGLTIALVLLIGGLVYRRGRHAQPMHIVS